MKFRRSGRAVPIGLLVGLLAMSADAADIVTLHATSGQFLLAGFYPAYVVFLKGLDPTATKTEWVDKPKTIPVINSYDGSTVDTVPMADADDIERALATAVRGAGAMRRLSGYERYQILRKAADLMTQRA